MKKLNFIQANKEISEHEINAVEKELGIKLPTDYRQFLLANNGGLPEECIFDIPNLGQSSLVFYGVHTGEEHSDFLLACMAYRNRLPGNSFPVGFDPGGNLICLVAEDKHDWALYFWDHERDNSPPELSKMYRLADSFSDFIDSLQYEENEAW